MNRTFNILSRTESAFVAAGASMLSVATVGAVMAIFATATPDSVSSDRGPIVLDKVVITATKSA